MNPKFLLMVSSFLIASGCGMQACSAIAPSMNEAGNSESCKASLRRSAITVAKDGFSINTFRLFKNYPLIDPQSESSYIEMDNFYRVTRSLPLSDQCLNPEIYEFEKNDGTNLRDSSKYDLKPVFVYLLGGSYYVIFIRSGYFSEEGDGEELVVSMAEYNVEGELVRRVGRISSWRNYEGSLVLLEACVASSGILLRKLNIDPALQAEDGRVISYMPPKLLMSQVLYPAGAGYLRKENDRAVKCNWDNYLSP